MYDYDLIVVGGGPAGSIATLYAARNRLKTLIVDQAHFPRDKVCGDAISGKSVAVLQELGLLEQIRQLPGTSIKKILFGSPDYSSVSVPLKSYPLHDRLTGQILPMEGFVVSRAIFDDFLFQQAKSNCASCIERFTVTDLLWDDKTVTGISGHDSSGQYRNFSAPMVLGCDGYKSVVAKKTGLYHYDKKHTMVGLRQYWSGVSVLKNEIELHFISQIQHGYFWIFPINDEIANIGIGMSHDQLRSQNSSPKQILENVIDSSAFRSRFSSAHPIERPVGWNLPVGSKRRTIYGNGFLLLGDAAGLIDPFTGEGIGNALYSARTAIETVETARNSSDYSASLLQNYEKHLWKLLGNELRISTYLYRLGRWRQWTNFIVSTAARNKNISDLLCGMMANSVPRRNIINPFFYLAQLFRKS
jgi:geranylgeranyl reductase family protein